MIQSEKNDFSPIYFFVLTIVPLSLYSLSLPASNSAFTDSDRQIMADWLVLNVQVKGNGVDLGQAVK